MYNNKAMILAPIVLALIILVLSGVTVYRSLAIKGDPAGQPQLPTVTTAIGGEQFNLEVASTMTEQNQGLSGRDTLGEHNGMLFVFNMPGLRFFWMKDMDFPLDMIWIRGNKIIGLQQNVPTPGQLEVTSSVSLPVYMSPGLSDRVIEINSGEAARLNLKVGDTVQINL